MKFSALACSIALACANSASSQTAQPIPSNPATPPSQWFPVPANAVFETGDAWSVGDTRYRLYGVQSCLRGTAFTNALGIKRDCGEASLAVLASLIRDLRPQCHQAAVLPAAKTIFVFCFATLAQGQSAGSRIDLGTGLISLGYGFASLKPDGQPVQMSYFVAQRSKTGLWAFADLPEPNAIILRALHTPPLQ